MKCIAVAVAFAFVKRKAWLDFVVGVCFGDRYQKAREGG